MPDGHVSSTARAARHASLQALFKHPTLAIVFENAARLTRLAHSWQGAEPIALATQRGLNVQKWSEHVVLWAL